MDICRYCVACETHHAVCDWNCEGGVHCRSTRLSLISQHCFLSIHMCFTSVYKHHLKDDLVLIDLNIIANVVMNSPLTLILHLVVDFLFRTRLL